MLRLTIEAAKRSFFDRDAVTAAMEKGERRALSRFGAFLRTRARSLIRKRKRASAPGQPPSSHVGYLRKFLFFAWDSATRSVVIGPALLGSKSPLPVPAVLEGGGPVSKTEYQLSGGRWVGGGSPLLRGARGGRPTRTRGGFIEPRPYMGPALEAERGALADLYRDCVRG